MVSVTQRGVAHTIIHCTMFCVIQCNVIPRVVCGVCAVIICDIINRGLRGRGVKQLIVIVLQHSGISSPHGVSIGGVATTNKTHILHLHILRTKRACHVVLKDQCIKLRRIQFIFVETLNCKCPSVFRAGSYSGWSL